MIDRRRFGALALSAAGLAAAGVPARAAEINDDGLYTQPWFLQTFLDLKEDLAEVTAGGRHLAVIWEQRGCPYCKEMHRVNFAVPRIADFVRANFGVIQLNVFGSRVVTDFDGEEIEERRLARKYEVIYSPTVQFFPMAPGMVDGKVGREAEVFRISGYLKPPHFLTMFEYVAERAYENTPFRAYLRDRKDRVL